MRFHYWSQPDFQDYLRKVWEGLIVAPLSSMQVPVMILYPCVIYLYIAFDVNLENPPGAGSKTDCSFSLGGTPSYGCGESASCVSELLL